MNKSTGITDRIKPTWGFLLSHPWHFISLGFGSGLSPIMPGTAGTVFGWAIFHLLTQQWPGIFTQLTWLLLTVAGFVLGIFTCQKTGDALNSPDDGSMVWDEIVGIWLVLLVFMPQSLAIEALAFFLFRLFDMSKPPPIRQFDRQLKGGLGVMFDDILAAVYAIIALFLLNGLYPMMGH